MPMSSLKDVYVHQIQDLWSACSQSKEVTERMAEEAADEELRSALRSGAEGIHRGMEAAVRIAGRHGFDPEEAHCRGMQGLVAEAREHALEAEWGDRDAKDAMLISQYQRMTHYAIAGWGTALAFARRLGLEEDAADLQDCLDNTRHGDKHMTAIAERRVNEQAA